MRYNRHTPICFVEDAFQWEVLLKQKGCNYEDLQIVAVTPEVDFLAKSSGMSYLSIEDFYYWDELNTSEKKISTSLSNCAMSLTGSCIQLHIKCQVLNWLLPRHFFIQ